MLNNPWESFCIACLSLSLAGVAHGQQSGTAPLPDAPEVSPHSASSATRAPSQDAVVFHKKIFWSVVAVDAASAVADAQTSWHDLQVNPNLHEQQSWLLGRRPSLGRYYATFAVLDGGGAYLSYKLLHSRHRLFRIAGWGVLAYAVQEHTRGWIGSVRQPFLPAPPGTGSRVPSFPFPQRR